MKYLESERFLVTSNDNEGRKNYQENYDRIFGEKSEEAPSEDAIEMKVKSYANLIVPLEAQIGPIEESTCDGCGEQACECDEHDPACAKLCTQDARCDCGRAARL